MPNQWDDLIEGVGAGAGAVLQGYQKMQDNQLAQDIYRTSLQGIQKTLLEWNQQNETKDQEKLGEINKLIGGDQTQQTDQTGSSAEENPVTRGLGISDLSISSTPADVGGKIPPKTTVTKKPVTMADLYQRVSDASFQLSQLGETGQMRAQQLAGYMETALKDKDTKIVKVGTDYFTYKVGDVMGTLTKLYSPDQTKASKQNIVWGQGAYGEENGEYYIEYPVEDVNSGQILPQRHREKVSKEEYDKYQRSLLEKEKSGRNYRGVKTPKTNYSFKNDMMMGETKKMADISRQVDASGGLDRLEQLAKEGDAKAQTLLDQYDQQMGVMEGYGVDPSVAINAFEDANSQDEFMGSVEEMQSYVSDIKTATGQMFTEDNFRAYMNDTRPHSEGFANKWDEDFWNWVEQLEADGIPNYIIDEYVKAPYDNWRKGSSIIIKP